jgi:hypothetical protein
MPAAHGRSSSVFLNAYNVSAFLSSFDSTKTVDTAEVTTFGSTSKAYVTGLRDGTITLGGYFDGGAGALDELMTMMLSDTQVSYGANLLTQGDLLANYAISTGLTQAGTAISGFSNSVFFGDATANRTGYKSFTPTIGKTYALSFFVQLDNSAAPILNPNAGRNLAAIIASANPTVQSVNLVTSSIYRIFATAVASTTGAFHGVYKDTIYAATGFRVSGVALNEVTTTASPNPILSICEDGAGAIGNRCTVAQVIDTSYQITGSISDAVQVTAEFQADGTGVSGAYRGVVLAPLAAYSNGQNTTGFDGGAASSNGLVANLHVLIAGGSTTVKIQHSTDNSSWTDLITFTTGAVQFCEHKTTTGTVHRYLRVNVVTDGLPVMVVTAARK